MKISNRIRCEFLLTSLTATLFLQTPSALSVTTWYVSKSGDDQANAGNVMNAPFASITNALAQASANDVIAVSAGVYTQCVSFATGKIGITICGGYDPSTWSWIPSNNTTTIRGNGGAAVTINAGASSNALVCLTLTTASSSYDGINTAGGATNLIVDSCTIISNRYGVNGGDRNLWNATFKNSIIAKNSNAGFYFNHSSNFSGANCFLYNCIVAGNGGDGFYTRTPGGWGVISAIAKNCLFTDNAGYGIKRDGGYGFGSVQNCLFFNNNNGPLFTSSQITDLGGNKSARDPRYINPVANDYRVADDSPAIGAGVDLSTVGVTNDLLGNIRPQGSWDIGPYESAAAGETATSSLAYVRTTGNNSTGDGTSEKPWATISYALGHIQAGGEVRVAAGTFAESLQVDSACRRMTIKGGYDASTWTWAPKQNQTTITVTGKSYPPAQFWAGSQSNTLAYLTLTGGGNTSAGIIIHDSVSNLVVEGCTIISNKYGLLGNYSLPLDTITLKNTLIAQNTYEGFSFFTRANVNGSSLYLYNCTVVSNGSHGYWTKTDYQTGGFVKPFIKNCLFTDNAGYGIYKINGGGDGSIQNCLFYNNTSGSTSGSITDLGSNWTTTPPRYANAVKGNYRLSKESLAIDSGTNLTSFGVSLDILGVARPYGHGFDRGAYEYDMPNGTVLVVK